MKTIALFGAGGKMGILKEEGSDQDHNLGEKIACTIFRPIARSHRITVEQMALLEPAMSESIAVTYVAVLRRPWTK